MAHIAVPAKLRWMVTASNTPIFTQERNAVKKKPRETSGAKDAQGRLLENPDGTPTNAGIAARPVSEYGKPIAKTLGERLRLKKLTGSL